MFVATALCLASLTQFPADRPLVYRGTVVEKGTNRPLAGVSVHTGGVDAPSAVTDARGWFDGVPAPNTGWFPVDGQVGPPLSIRPEDDRVWPWTVPGGDDKSRGKALGSVYERTIQSRWKGQGPGATLVVECPPVGTVEAVVRGPDGRPLADSPILVIPLHHSGAETIRFAGRTDHAGAFRIRSFEGFRNFGVEVAGVGFGSTGEVDVIAGGTARPEMPPLARFARIEGRLDDALTGPGTEVCRGPENALAPFVACDDRGRFAMTDVPPGDVDLWVRRDGKRLRALPRQVRIGPGQVARDVVLRPAPPPREGEERRRAQLWGGGDENRIVAWVEGTVGDDRGRPIAGATVYVRVEYDGGFRTNSDVKKTTTDREGRYHVEGPWHRSMRAFAVLVAAEGRPWIMAHAPAPDSTVEPSELKPARLDVAMGAKRSGGALAVAVVRAGRKLPGANVSLSSAAIGRILEEFSMPIEIKGENEVRRLVSTQAVAGADGVARFENLPPGAYEATVTPPFDPNRVPGAPIPKGVASGIDVPSGGNVEAAAAVPPDPAPTRFRLLGPDGVPAADREVWLHVRPSRMRRGSTYFKLDGNGEHEQYFPSGLGMVEFRYGNAKGTSVQGEPYYQAEATVAVSPAIAEPEPIELRAVHREPGSIKVRLLDADGAPARGCVMILSTHAGSLGAGRAGTVDEEGWVRFADVASGDYFLRGAVDGSAVVPQPQFGPLRLTDDELIGHATVFDKKAVVEPGAETVVELRVEPVGYVRVDVRAPADHAPSDYTAWSNGHESPGRSHPNECSEDRAEYLFGPIPLGRWPLSVSGGAWGVARVEREVVVTVEPGRVVRIEVDAPLIPASPIPGPDRRLGGISAYNSGPDGATMTVVAADGASPAFGARALFIPAEGAAPIAVGTADAAGRLSWTHRPWRSAMEADGKAPEPAREPTILAWGADGAGPVVATVKPGEPPRLVLPALNVVAGRVAIAGAAAGGDSRIRVAVVAEGNDAVAVAMGRETTADPDGRFRLAGLVPGRYVVQAVRDGIWTSKPVPLVIEAGRDAGPIELDVPAPGATIALRLVDRAGGPVAAGYSIRRGDGPLVDPPTLAGRTDERGATVVRGLAAGVFALAVEGDAEPRALDVPPFRPGAGPLDVRLEVSRPGT